MWPEKSLGNDSLDEAEAKQFSERIEQYMLKAVREAKEHTSWANTNEEYEGALLSFIRAILERNESNQFLTDFADFHKRVARAGIFNSLSQCLLKLTVPGVPDIYQGNEFYDFSLVDPDNRRQVDYRTREAALEQLQSHTASSHISIERLRSLVSYPENGSLKLYLTWKTLGLRAKEATLFREGQYKPLAVSGQKSQHVVAFAREHQGKTAIVAVPRLCAALLGEKYDTICNHEACGDEVWGDTRLEVAIPNGACYHNVFTGECMHTEADEGKNGVSVARLFSHFPAALLMSSPSACA
jgi:(1->4)-alpha-D-glucan 1-alpha-D-glucosylmutase